MESSRRPSERWFISVQINLHVCICIEGSAVVSKLIWMKLQHFGCQNPQLFGIGPTRINDVYEYNFKKMNII